MRVWVNGTVLPNASGPALSVTDHGFTVGDGVFESIKVVDGQPFALTRHLARLSRSATGLGLALPDHARIRTAIEELLADDPLPLGRIRVTYTDGPAPLGSGRGAGESTLVVAVAPMDPALPSVAVHTVPWRRNEHGATAGLKTTSYAENVIALAYAAERGAGEAIFGNVAGSLCEGTGSNIGYVIDGEARTPPLSTGALAGITRELLLEWAEIRELAEPLSVLAEAEEIFLLSTTRDVQPVHRCDDREFAAPRPVTEALMKVWREREPADSDP